ncbi:MAG: biotin transporter BioY [Spirochaetaceae bacterium]|jgi:biotin transport system substrate-specific component|nr:biotin transporter BioY [Spirochaetaceae bacterium]
MEKHVSLSTKRRALTGTTMTALFGALIAAGAFISIPLPFSPVPVVLQNMFAMLSGLVLGPLLGGAAAALYLIAGALGAPVFAGATGGIAHFFGPTGGFLIGYLLASLTAGFIAGRPRADRKTSWVRIILGTGLGLLAVYLPGVIHLKAVLNTSWAGALAAGFIPFIIGDVVKGVVAALIAPRLRRVAADQLDG